MHSGHDSKKAYKLFLENLPRIFIIGLVLTFIFSVIVQLGLVVQSLTERCDATTNENCSIISNQLSSFTQFSEVVSKNALLLLLLGPLILLISTLGLISAAIYRMKYLQLELKNEKTDSKKSGKKYKAALLLIIFLFLLISSISELILNSSFFVSKDEVKYVSILEDSPKKFPIGFKSNFNYIMKFIEFFLFWLSSYLILHLALQFDEPNSQNKETL
ncbi:MAG: hypothetical protein N3E37_01840 [Candidatus Micrarchaeota archaeon]|nr:hypothetical protein [Candidatus Micrarchaeota archaeon]